MDTAYQDHAPVTLKDTMNSLFHNQQLNGWNVYATLEGTKLVIHMKPPSHPRQYNAKYRRMNNRQQHRDSARAAERKAVVKPPKKAEKRKAQGASLQPQPVATQVSPCFELTAPSVPFSFAPESFSASTVPQQPTPSKAEPSDLVEQDINLSTTTINPLAAAFVPAADQTPECKHSEADSDLPIQLQPPKTPAPASELKGYVSEQTYKIFCETPSSPPNIKDGEVSCMACGTLLGDEDCVFLCVVCGNVVCGCDSKILDRHNHQGYDNQEIWLGEEQLLVFRKLHDV